MFLKYSMNMHFVFKYFNSVFYPALQLRSCRSMQSDMIIASASITMTS